MKLGTKKGWKSLVQIPMGRKSATQFCMFPKVRSAGQTPGNARVFLNVYDLTPVNGYMYWAGLGIFHSRIEDFIKHATNLLRNCSETAHMDLRTCWNCCNTIRAFLVVPCAKSSNTSQGGIYIG